MPPKPKKTLGEACPEILIAVLTRDTDTIVNPITGNTFLPGGTAFNEIFDKKCKATFKKLQEENADIINPLINMVNQEVRGEMMWSPWARENNPSAPQGDQDVLDDLIERAHAALNITITTRRAPPPGLESMNNEQCFYFIKRVFSRTSDEISNPMTHNALYISDANKMKLAISRIESLIPPSSTDMRFVQILEEELLTNKAWSAYKKEHAPPNTPFGPFSELAGLINNVYAHLGISSTQDTDGIYPEMIRRLFHTCGSLNDLYRMSYFKVMSVKMQYQLEQELEQELEGRYYKPAKDDSRTLKSRTKINSKTLSKNSAGDERPIQELCRQKFSTLTIPTDEHGKLVKPFVNKLKKVCDKVVDKKECNLVAVSQRIKDLSSKCKNNSTPITINAINGHELETLLAFWYQAQRETREEYMNNKFMFYKNISKNTRNGEPSLRIVYDGQVGIDAGGLRIHFFQQVIKQLFARDNTRFLVETETSPRSNIYNFNYNFVESANDTISSYDLFRFFGEFTAFMIINGFKYPGHLNHAILANLLYNDLELDLDDYALFYMLDYPTDARIFVSTLKYPDGIESVGWTFNNKEEKMILDGKIPEDSKENVVNAATYRKYVGLLGRHHLINSQKGLLVLEAFQKGFFIGRRYMRNHGYTISIIDAMITGSKITKKAIDEIVGIVRSNTSVSGTQKDTDLLDWFCNILRGTVALPKDRWTSEGNSENLLPKDHRKEFMPALLEWWTGNSSFYDGYSYNLILKDYTRTASNRPVPFPVSHTCFQSMDVSRGIESQDDLFYRLIKAILSSGKEFHIA